MNHPNQSTTRTRARKGTRGAVMLESALIFLTFIAMLIGAFDFGQFLFIHQALVERIRQETGIADLATAAVA